MYTLSSATVKSTAVLFHLANQSLPVTLKNGITPLVSLLYAQLAAFAQKITEMFVDVSIIVPHEITRS